MSSHGLTRENILATLPAALQNDESVVALAKAFADVLSQRPAEIDRILLYPAIDQMDERLLDILAYDFKVDWWDANYTIEEKRQTLKDSWRVHKVLGTKAAVRMAISAIYPNTKVLEWFEYGGQPYHFQLDINISDDSIDSDRMRRVLARLNYYKSLRSHNDGVRYFMEPPEPATAQALTACPGSRSTMEAVVSVPPPVKPGGEANLTSGAFVPVIIEKLPIELELAGAVPTVAVTAQFNASMVGAEFGMTVPTFDMTALPPSGSDTAQVRTATPGLRLCMNSTLEPTAKAPHAVAPRTTGVRFCGCIMGMAVNVAARETEYPGGTPTAHGAAMPAGVYQKIVMEVSKDEALE